MINQWLVQVGRFGQLGRFVAVDPIVYERGDEVICRTRRGLEVGRLMCGIEEREEGDDGDSAGGEPLGQLLRPMTDQDRLLWERINRHQQRALAACEDKIRERELPVALMDVESLFDGATLYFYYLGEVDERVEALTEELAGTYESKVKFRKFADRLAQGCGPGCGTESAVGGCGSGAGGCATCQVAGACSKPAVDG